MYIYICMPKYIYRVLDCVKLCVWMCADGVTVDVQLVSISVVLFAVYTVLAVVGVVWAIICMLFNIMYRNKRLVHVLNANVAFLNCCSKYKFKGIWFGQNLRKTDCLCLLCTLKYCVHMLSCLIPVNIHSFPNKKDLRSHIHSFEFSQ